MQTSIADNIGFGCGRIRGGAERKQSAEILEAAYESGVRYFDVAPSYGLGYAERILGEMFANDNSVLFTTKVGIASPRAPGLLSMARSIVKPMVKNLPWLRNSIINGLNRTTSRGNFDVDDVRKSLESSFIRLGRGHINSVLLHEAGELDNLVELESLLLGYVKDGRISSFGTSSGKNIGEFPVFGSILQGVWSPGRFISDAKHAAIYHGLLRKHVGSHAKLLNASNDLDGWSQILNCDIKDPNVWPSVLIRAVLAFDPHARILISSSNPRRFKRMLEAVPFGNAETDRSAQLLHEMVGSA